MSYVEVTLERDGFNQPWGLRMTGGVDVGAPLTVARVSTLTQPSPRSFRVTDGLNIFVLCPGPY